MEIVDRVIFENGAVLNVYRSVDEPLFLAVEIAKLIDYSPDKVGQMLENLYDHEKLTDKTYRAGQNREVWFVTEDGLNSILLRSTKPIARSLRIFVNRNLRTMRREMKMRPSDWFEFIHREAQQEELALEKWFDYQTASFSPDYWRWVKLGRPHLKIDPNGPPYYDGEEEET